MDQIEFLTNEVISDYIFGKLSKDKEVQMDEFLEQNMDYNNSINALMDLCLKQNLNQQEFDKTLAKNPVFTNDFERKSDHLKINEKPNSLKFKKVIPKWVKLTLPTALAAAILLLFLLMPIKSDYPIILKQHQMVEMERGTETQIPETAQILFNEKKYQDFISYNYSEKELTNLKLQFYMGISAMQLGELDLDITEQYFTNVSNSDSRFKEDAMFYLAQVYLLKGEKKKCLECLRKIDGNQYFHRFKDLQKRCK